MTGTSSAAELFHRGFRVAGTTCVRGASCDIAATSSVALMGPMGTHCPPQATPKPRGPHAAPVSVNTPMESRARARSLAFRLLRAFARRRKARPQPPSISSSSWSASPERDWLSAASSKLTRKIRIGSSSATAAPTGEGKPERATAAAASRLSRFVAKKHEHFSHTAKRLLAPGMLPSRELGTSRRTQRAQRMTRRRSRCMRASSAFSASAR